MFKSTIMLILAVVLIAFFIAVGPLAFIWAINEVGAYLWPDRVLPFTFWTWLAAAVIMAVIGPSIKVSKK